MKNKILVEINIPVIDETFDMYIPLNKNIANIIQLICKAINEINRIEELNFSSMSLYNDETALAYSPDIIIKESNIRNGTRLILM